MSSLKRQEELVKDSLSEFIAKHVDGAPLSCIDDIVLSYMTSVLEEFGVETPHEEPFNIDEFIEMMGAYFPGFIDVDSSTVCDWLVCLAKQLSEIKCSAQSTNFAEPLLLGSPHQLQQQPNGDLHSPTPPLNSESSCIRLYITSSAGKSPPTSIFNDDERLANGLHPESPENDCGAEFKYASCTDKEDIANNDKESEDDNSGDQEDDDRVDVLRVEKQIELLQELFPNVCAVEVSQCLAIARGNTEQAAQLIMHRVENSERFSPNSMQPLAKLRSRPQDDKQLKEHILERYAYVDQADDQREHKPVAPKTAPKKLVRYRDSKIVSLKGEKYTEVKKDDDEDGMKKTHVSLKSARQYRFH